MMTENTEALYMNISDKLLNDPLPQKEVFINDYLYNEDPTIRRIAMKVNTDGYFTPEEKLRLLLPLVEDSNKDVYEQSVLDILSLITNKVEDWDLLLVTLEQLINHENSNIRLLTYKRLASNFSPSPIGEFTYNRMPEIVLDKIAGMVDRSINCEEVEEVKIKAVCVFLDLIDLDYYDNPLKEILDRIAGDNEEDFNQVLTIPIGTTLRRYYSSEELFNIFKKYTDPGIMYNLGKYLYIEKTLLYSNLEAQKYFFDLINNPRISGVSLELMMTWAAKRFNSDNKSFVQSILNRLEDDDLYIGALAKYYLELIIKDYELKKNKKL